MKKIFFLLVIICLVIKASAQCNVHTDTLNNGNITSNGDTIIANINMDVCDSITLYAPNWMAINTTFVSPNATPYTNTNNKVLYPEDSGLWTIMDGIPPFDVIFVKVSFYTLTGITEKQEKEVSIYPNPTTDRLIINTTAINLEVTFTNMLGQVILSQHNTKVLDVSDLPRGTYIVSVVINGIASRKKVILN